MAFSAQQEMGDDHDEIALNLIESRLRRRHAPVDRFTAGSATEDNRVSHASFHFLSTLHFHSSKQRFFSPRLASPTAGPVVLEGALFLVRCVLLKSFFNVRTLSLRRCYFACARAHKMQRSHVLFVFRTRTTNTSSCTASSYTAMRRSGSPRDSGVARACWGS